MTNLEPNSASHAVKKRMNREKAPVLAFQKSANLCSQAMVSFKRNCSRMAARMVMVNESITTRSDYSTNRLSTNRSIRVAVK